MAATDEATGEDTLIVSMARGQQLLHLRWFWEIRGEKATERANGYVYLFMKPRVDVVRKKKYSSG